MDITEQNDTETIELLIKDIVYPGRGLARSENMVVFVSGVLPDERIRARITSKRKRFAEAQLVEILEPAPNRVQPECPLVATIERGEEPSCPGCVYQHMRYKEELRIKDAQLTDLLERLGGGAPLGEHLPPVPAPSPYGYRNKLVLHASVSEGARSFGYFGHDNESIVALRACPLAVPAINARLGELADNQEFMSQLEDRDDISLRATGKDGVVHWTGRRPKGMRWLTEGSPLGDISVPVTGFTQVNPPVAGLLLKAVQSIVRKARPSAVVDLYCGAGLFALAAATVHVEAVLGIDSDARAIQAARFNARERGLQQAEFIEAPVARVLQKALSPLDRNLAMLIVDPPRRGLDGTVLKIIAEKGPAQMLYVSCAPDTLARDVKALRNAGYQIASRQLFDMFPRTGHFETLLNLTRK